MQMHLNILVSLILRDYFQESRCLLIIADNYNYEYEESLQWVNIYIFNDTFDAKLIFDRHYGCQGVIINTAYPITVLEFMEKQIRLNIDRFNYRRYLFVPSNDPQEELFDIFENKAIDFIADLLIIVPDENINTPFVDWKFLEFNKSVNYQLYTHKFVGFNQSNQVVLLDEWNCMTESFKNGVNLYPDKLTNGYGRSFKIATITYKPNTIPATQDGLELRVAITFCEQFNLTVSLYIDEEGEFGEIYDNWTGYGILGNVLKDYGDIGFGSVFSWEHEYFYLDFTKPVYRSGVTAVAPAPVLVSNWLVPMFSFSSAMWVGVGLSFLTCAIALFIFDQLQYKLNIRKVNRIKLFDNSHKFNSLMMGFLDTAAIFLNQPFGGGDNQLKGNKKHYIYNSMLLFSILITSSYSSGLASCMTVPRFTDPIRTMQDLVDSKVHWGATSIAWIMSIMNAPELNYVLLTERFLEANKSVLETYNGKRFAFALERLPGGHYALGDYITEDGVSKLRLMDEDIYFEYCVFMVKKSSIWLDQLDSFMLLIAQSGLQKFWEMQAVNNYMNTKIQRVVKFSIHLHNMDALPVALTIEHVEGVFAVLFLGLTTAFICFLLELYVARKVKSL